MTTVSQTAESTPAQLPEGWDRWLLWTLVLLLVTWVVVGEISRRQQSQVAAQPANVEADNAVEGGPTQEAGRHWFWSTSAPWALLLAAIPASMIVHHALYLNAIKRLTLKNTRTSPPTSHLSQHTQDRERLMYETRRRSVDEFKEFFTWPTLFKRYGLPFFLMVVSILGVFYFVCQSPDCCSGVVEDSVHAGFRYGALGAYVYLLLSLGQRSLQADILPGFVVWCAAQMVLGALMGAVLSVFWLNPQGEATGTLTPVAAGLFFLAGLSPRLVISTVQESLRKLWLPGSSQGIASRTIPLGQVRGMTPAIEERFNEEGIYDSFTLGMANPLKLIRNTPFDQRQILAWIDEALLMYVLPQHWQLLESEGITGAIDLAWLYYQTPDAPANQPGNPLAAAEKLRQLAERVKLAPEALAEVVARLAEDAQVVQVWALYQDDGANL
jgi:hypothetical protein